MARKYWIGVVFSSMAEVMARDGFVAFSHGKKGPVEKLKPGDRVIFYATKITMDGDPVQAFVALAEASGDDVTEAAFPGTDLTCWQRAARFSEVREVPVKPMLEDLAFVTNPRYWGMAFRRSLFEITEADFTRISNAMRGT